ncbi:hypothetical protein ACSG7Z_001749 [Cronobacter dublinensis]
MSKIKVEGNRQQAAGSRQQAAGSKQQTANSKQQTANSKQRRIFRRFTRNAGARSSLLRNAPH